MTYDNRASSFYAPYSGYHSPVVYHDSFSPFLMGWLMSDALSSSNRATWIYNHRDSIDDARYQELIRHDVKLQAELEALKSKGATVNPDYVPAEFSENPDLMYDKTAVQPKPVEAKSGGSSFWGWVLTLMVIGVIGAAVYVIFFKEFK